MKFIVSSTKLLGHLQTISRVISNKNTMAILDNVVFELNGTTLQLTASDIETTVISSFEVEQGEENGKVAIATKLLIDTLKEFPEQPLQFEINNDNLELVITSENGSYNFIGKNADEFPALPNLKEDACTLKINATALLAAINKTLFCSADDDLRPVMNGVYFDIDTNCLTAVATDAHKLVRYRILDVQADAKTGFILPKKPANLLKTILAKEEGDVEINFDNKNIRFSLPNYTMVCLQIEGRFPSYEAVIPQTNPRKVIVDKATLVNALKRVAVYANQGSNLVKLELTGNKIKISAQDVQFATSAEETIACQYADQDMNIGFKAPFLTDLINNIPSDDVVLELADPSRAGLILPLENTENRDLLMLLMPMLLTE